MTQPSGTDGAGDGGQADQQADETAGRDSGARAETYLRLFAEAELRRELARPRAAWARRFLAPASGQVERRVGRARLAVGSLRDWLTGTRQPGSPWEGQDHVRRVAGVLTAAGVLSGPAARSVTRSFGWALAARGLAGDHDALRSDPVGDRIPAPAGPVMAAGINAQLDLAADGYRARTHVLALVLTPDEAIMTTVTWLTGRPAAGPRAEDGQPDRVDWEEHFRDLVYSNKGQATDNRGGTYRLRMGGGGGSPDGCWEGCLKFTPVPPAGLEWLDITLAPGLDPVRVDLTAAAAAAPTAARDGSAARPYASPADRAERIIDSASELLIDLHDPQWKSEADMDGIVVMVGALRASGALAPDSPALARLVTVARRLQPRVPPELAGPGAARPADLPEPWLATLASYQQRQPAERAAAAAVAVLPEVDGVRCIITGLITEAGASSGTTLQLLGWGWPTATDRPAEVWRPFSCWARDDAGRWYRGREQGYGSYGQMNHFEFRLSPAVHPEATSLEVILTGLSGQVSATIPVMWSRMP